LRIWAFYALLACFAWGTTPIAVKLLLPFMTPMAIGFYRFLIASLILAILLILTGRARMIRATVSGRGLIHYVVLGLLGALAFTALFFIGVQFTTAGKASLLVSANPIVTVVLAHIFLGERTSARMMAWTLLGFLGVFLVLIGDLQTLLGGNFLGDLLSLGAGISWAAFSVAGKDWTRNHEPSVSTSLVIFLGAVLMAPLNLVTSSLGLPLSVYELALLLYLGAFTAAAAYLLWIKALKLAGPSSVGVFQFTVPLVTMVLDIAILGEAVDTLTVGGFILVAASIYQTLR